MKEAMECLKDELIKSPADAKAHRILLIMVQKTLAAIDRGIGEPQTFTRTALLVNVEGELQGQQMDAARWLRKGDLEKYLESRQASLCDRLRRAAVTEMPVIRSSGGKGGKGIERSYWLDVVDLPDAEETEEERTDTLQVLYRRSAPGEVKPSLLLRLIFRNGEMSNRSWRGGAMLTVILSGLILLAVWLLAGLFGLAFLDQALTLRQLLGATFFVLCGWLLWTWCFDPWFRLVDDRVVKATPALLSLLEDSAEIELHRDSDKRPWTRFVRFSGDCPICGGRVLLALGKPSHSLPLVGRCVESPYSHIFAFDRVHLKGDYIGPLGQPGPLCRQGEAPIRACH